MQKRFSELIISCAQAGYSDVHVCGGQPIVYRKNGSIRFEKKMIWSHAEVDSLVQSILSSKNMSILRERWSVDFAISVGNVRVRVSIFNTDHGPSLAIRLLPDSIPTIEKLNLHTSLSSISELKSGLVLICGTTGCGKTTTIASVLDDINSKRAAHIVTLEDPIEYRIPSRQSFIEQREVGTHVPSVERGLIDVMRADPDVIMVGELRDPETIALTLNAAESGHLVIATLHATNMEDALYRIINSAPPEAEEYIRHQLASTIAWVIVQKLIFIERAGIRVPMLSIMRGTQQIKGIVREKKLYQIDNSMHTGKSDGMFTEERYLKEYLDIRDKFHNPMVNFKPDKNATSHNVYHKSAIFQSTAVPASKAATTVTQGTGQKTERIKIDHQDGVWGAETASSIESQYVIDESVDLLEIIAQAEDNIKTGK
jgi:pilus retraction protein PilT